MSYNKINPIVIIAFLAAFACSEDEEFVFGGTVVIEVQESSLTVSNQTNVIIYYFAVERNTLSIIDWIPCNTPDRCGDRGINPIHSRVVPYMDITGWKSGADVVIFLWYLMKDSTTGNGYRMEYLSSQTVATPSQ